MATIVKNHKEYEIGKERYFVERYWEKGMRVFLWRYGYTYMHNGMKCGMIMKDHLLSKPNIKRMFA